jgi:hypothetical protein
MVKIDAISGNTLTIDPPLHLAYPAANGVEIRPIDYIDQVGMAMASAWPGMPPPSWWRTISSATCAMR